MDWDLKITDMAGATPEHSAVIVNFVAAIRYQLKNSTCYVYSDNVQYRFKDNQGNNKIVIPDASINCRTKSRRGNTFTDAPRFVMEVLSPSTENYDPIRNFSCIGILPESSIRAAFTWCIFSMPIVYKYLHS